jgi:hypothetical protein
METWFEFEIFNTDRRPLTRRVNNSAARVTIAGAVEVAQLEEHQVGSVLELQ